MPQPPHRSSRLVTSEEFRRQQEEYRFLIEQERLRILRERAEANFMGVNPVASAMDEIHQELLRSQPRRSAVIPETETDDMPTPRQLFRDIALGGVEHDGIDEWIFRQLIPHLRNIADYFIWKASLTYYRQERIKQLLNAFYKPGVLRHHQERCISRRIDGAILMSNFHASIFGESNRENNEYAYVVEDITIAIESCQRLYPCEWIVPDILDEYLVQTREGSRDSSSYLHGVGLGHRENYWEMVFWNSMSIREIEYYLVLQAVIWYCDNNWDITLDFGAYNFPHLQTSQLPSRSREVLEEHIFYPIEFLTHYEESGESIAPPLPYMQQTSHQLGEEMKTAQQDKTLLRLLTTITKKWDTLIKNPNAYTWSWLNRRIQQVNYRNRRECSREQAIERVLKILKKRTGKEWQYGWYPSNGYYPQCMLSKYHDLVIDEYGGEIISETYRRGQLQERWIQQAYFERWKNEGLLVWHPVLQHWYHKRCRAEVNQYDSVRQQWRKVPHWITDKSSASKVFICSDCGGLFFVTDKIRDEDQDRERCIICHNKINNHWPNNEADAMGGYHSHRRWDFKYYRKEKEDFREPCFGLEVEMHSRIGPANKAAWSITKTGKLVYPNPLFYFERDGSLLEGGLEMVTNPMSLEYHREFWGKLLPEIRKVCVGWNIEQYTGAGDVNYGIHVTFSRKVLSDFQIARLVKFCEDEKNKIFMRSLAQRNKIFGGSLIGSKACRIIEQVHIGKGKMGTSFNRYSCVNVKEKLIEIRFFRTTLNQESFMKNLEWFHSMVQWIKTTPYSYDHAAYINWLLSKPEHMKKYINLIGYFNRKHLPVQGEPNRKFKNHFYKTFERGKLGQLALLEEPDTEVKIKYDGDVILEGDLECV